MIVWCNDLWIKWDYSNIYFFCLLISQIINNSKLKKKIYWWNKYYYKRQNHSFQGLDKGIRHFLGVPRGKAMKLLRMLFCFHLPNLMRYQLRDVWYLLVPFCFMRWFQVRVRMQKGHRCLLYITMGYISSIKINICIWNEMRWNIRIE